MHVARDDALLRALAHVLAVDQKFRDDSRHEAAMVEDRFRERAHQPTASVGVRPLPIRATSAL